MMFDWTFDKLIYYYKYRIEGESESIIDRTPNRIYNIYLKLSNIDLQEASLISKNSKSL